MSKKHRPMMSCCDKPMDYYWSVGTRKVKGFWRFKCYICGKEQRV